MKWLKALWARLSTPRQGVTLVINNPTPEPASDSIRRALLRAGWTDV